MNKISKKLVLTLCASLTVAFPFGLAACSEPTKPNGPLFVSGKGTPEEPFQLTPKGGKIEVDINESAARGIAFCFFTTDDEQIYTVDYTGDLTLYNSYGFEVYDRETMPINNAYSFYFVNNTAKKVVSTLTFKKYIPKEVSVDTQKITIGSESTSTVNEFEAAHFEVQIPSDGYYKIDTALEDMYFALGTIYTPSVMGDAMLEGIVSPFDSDIDPYTYYLTAGKYYIDVTASGTFCFKAASKPAPKTSEPLTLDQKKNECTVTENGVFYSLTPEQTGFYALFLDDPENKVKTRHNVIKINAGETGYFKLFTNEGSAICSVTAKKVSEITVQGGAFEPGSYAFVFPEDTTYTFQLSSGHKIYLNSINWEPIKKDYLEWGGFEGDVVLITIEGNGTATLTVTEMSDDHVH